jgi:endothelin-converting enzyme
LAETAPLLRDPEQEEVETQGRNLTFADHVGAIAQEPLTPLTKVLLVLGLVLLLLSSVSEMKALQIL